MSYKMNNMNFIEKYPIIRIISGGQTGADRAGLDFALDNNILIGGWCPKGRRSEDGIIPLKYTLLETSSSAYPQRTRQNVLDSDATLIFTYRAPQGGTALTIKYAIKYKKPHLVLDFSLYKSLNELAYAIIIWLWKIKPNILNIAGPRASECPQIYKLVYKTLSLSLKPISLSNKATGNKINNLNWPPIQKCLLSKEYQQNKLINRSEFNVFECNNTKPFQLSFDIYLQKTDFNTNK